MALVLAIGCTITAFRINDRMLNEFVEIDQFNIVGTCKNPVELHREARDTVVGCAHAAGGLSSLPTIRTGHSRDLSKEKTSSLPTRPTDGWPQCLNGRAGDTFSLHLDGTCTRVDNAMRPGLRLLYGLKININTATADDLTALPRIGPKTSQRIFAFRKKHGNFATVDDLVGVRGIGEKTLTLLRPLITHDFAPRPFKKASSSK